MALTPGGLTGGEGEYNGLNARNVFGDLVAFKPETNTWRHMDLIGGPPYNLVPPARRGHTATEVNTPSHHKYGERKGT